LIPDFAAKWIGLPYADKGRGPAYDCWGLARAVLAAEAGLVLPDYADAYTTACDRFSVARAVE
jgi:cell wall-associated NlpC family hydrolase